VAAQALAKKRFSSASDVWSFGVVMHEIFTNGGTPYKGMTNETVRVPTIAAALGQFSTVAVSLPTSYDMAHMPGSISNVLHRLEPPILLGHTYPRPPLERLACRSAWLRIVRWVGCLLNVQCHCCRAMNSSGFLC